jgi:hypothetical protein
MDMSTRLFGNICVACVVALIAVLGVISVLTFFWVSMFGG